MKRIIFSSILLALNLSVNAQVSIGKEQINGTSTLLDFYDAPTNKGGLILPAITTLPQSPANGNFVFDTNTETVKVFQNNQWVDLSEAGDNTAIHHNAVPEHGGGMIMGAGTSDAQGVLVLESPDKAMILPKVAEPHLNVKSPYPGMICYDTTSKALAVYNGSKWYYWN